MRPHLVAAATLLAATLLAPSLARAAPDSLDPAGSVYEIRFESESVTSGNGSAGSSRNVSTLTERVIAVRDGGVELEFDLPEGASAGSRALNWQFPARVFKPAQGPLVLLNASDAQQRLHAWLSEEERRLCGHWVFTWTSQYIECDPQSVLGIVEGYMEPTDVREGAMYREPAAREPVRLGIHDRGSNRSTFVARMEIDPDAVRRQRAQTDVAVAQMTGRPPVSMDAALQARSSERISGTITTTFETDSSGRVTRRTRVTQIDIADENGSAEHRTTTDTTTWTLSSSAPAH